MAPGVVDDEASNGTTGVALRPKEDKTEATEEATSLAATTTGHAHAEEQQHQKCCCCCQLRSKEAVKEKAEDNKKEASTDSKTKEQKDDETGEKKEGDAEEDKEAQDQTMKCEIKHLDRKYDDKDEAFFAEASNSPPAPPSRTTDFIPTAQGRDREARAEGLVASVRFLHRAAL
ncbi:uncharacterized protein PG986_012706 [Apiospora aurea]|uniref:Uncharacterized protein n=1 Tax=Apiospora aurea TaxID=335848 RepID=A0ABR1Q0R6_9PEZI